MREQVILMIQNDTRRKVMLSSIVLFIGCLLAAEAVSESGPPWGLVENVGLHARRVWCKWLSVARGCVALLEDFERGSFHSNYLAKPMHFSILTDFNRYIHVSLYLYVNMSKNIFQNYLKLVTLVATSCDREHAVGQWTRYPSSMQWGQG